MLTEQALIMQSNLRSMQNVCVVTGMELSCLDQESPADHVPFVFVLISRHNT
jgi:hypothetical protein